MPSRCMRQADSSTASPAVSKCSTYCRPACLPLSPSSSSCRRALRSRRGRARRSSPSANSRSKAKKTSFSDCPSDRAACSAEKSGAPWASSATASPSIMQSGSFAACFGDRRELLRPVEALARAQPGLAVLDAQLQAIAVELDLVRPSRPARARARPACRAAVRRRSASLRDLAWLRLAFGERSPCRRRPSCCFARPRRPRAACRS